MTNARICNFVKNQKVTENPELLTVLGKKLQNPTKNFTCTHRQQEPVALMEVGTDDPEIPLPSFKSNLGGMYIMMQCTVPSSALCHVCTTYYH